MLQYNTIAEYHEYHSMQFEHNICILFSISGNVLEICSERVCAHHRSREQLQMDHR